MILFCKPLSTTLAAKSLFISRLPFRIFYLHTLRNSPQLLSTHFHFHPPLDSSPSADFSADDFLLFPSFLTKSEHDLLVVAANRKLNRVIGSEGAYAESHFDHVISGYRECHSSHWGKDEENITPILDRVKAFYPDLEWLPPHILDLSASGEIRPHVDNPEYSGAIISGISLLSTAVMILRHEKDPSLRFDVRLEPGSLYIQRGSSRYNFTHEIPGEQKKHIFRDEAIPKERRISIMLRDKKKL